MFCYLMHMNMHTAFFSVSFHFLYVSQNMIDIINLGFGRNAFWKTYFLLASNIHFLKFFCNEN